VLIDGNSQLMETLDKLVDTIGCEKIDLLLIDADHRLPGVKRDYQLYAPLVREGGLIIFHDVIRPERQALRRPYLLERAESRVTSHRTRAGSATTTGARPVGRNRAS
jgi:predicted O-methyltransferase YrrM